MIRQWIRPIQLSIHAGYLLAISMDSGDLFFTNANRFTAQTKIIGF